MQLHFSKFHCRDFCILATRSTRSGAMVTPTGFYDYSLYSVLSDEEQMKLAIDRSLIEDNNSIGSIQSSQSVDRQPNYQPNQFTTRARLPSATRHVYDFPRANPNPTNPHPNPSSANLPSADPIMWVCQPFNLFWQYVCQKEWVWKQLLFWSALSWCTGVLLFQNAQHRNLMVSIDTFP